VVADDFMASSFPHQHQVRLADRFGLGPVSGPPSPVTGGFHHRMWRLDAAGGRFAVKQLAADTDVTSADVLSHYEATEAVAAAFASRGIPALAALACRGKYLHLIEDQAYLVYPWSDGRACAKNAIAEHHIDVVATILARMHGTDLVVPNVDKGAAPPITADGVVGLVELATRRNVRGAAYLGERLEDLVAVVRSLDRALPELAQHSVISHGDLDHKNVLWDASGNALLIDWESARHINPSYETVLEALDWSGITAHFQTRPYERFLERYTGAGGQLRANSIPAAFSAILGAWVNWMMYNVGRAAGLEGLRHRALGSEQVDLALATLLRLEKQVPRLRDLALHYAR
jgi:Ser/Thr protein kinase RdoA (MazF antagonist)